MAPESLTDGHFSEKSDIVSIMSKHKVKRNDYNKLNIDYERLHEYLTVCIWIINVQWSFGVTMWEIFSGGKTPYPGTDPRTLLRMLEKGERMPQPYNTACTDEL